jgi:hypothetical protein
VPYKVFISYSTKNLDIVQWAKHTLDQPGLTEVFAAEYSVAPGTVLNAEIMKAIRGCDLFVLLWTQEARKSDYVPQEIGIAVAANKMILPIVMEANLPVPGFISNLKYLDAHRDMEGAFAWLAQFVRDNSAHQQDQQKAAALLALLIGGVWLFSSGK